MSIQTMFFNAMAFVTWALQVAILIRMYRSEMRTELRMFFAYMVFTMTKSVGLFAIRNYFGFRSPEYFVGYWLGFVVNTVMMFLIIQEVYAKVLYRYEGLRELSKMIFRWAFMLLVVVAVVSALASPAADREQVYSGILLFDRSTVMVAFGLMMLLFVFAKTLALGWGECVFGIAVGLCLACSTDLAVLTLRTHYSNEVADLAANLKPIAYVVVLGIWTAYVYRSGRARREVEPFRNGRMEEWNVAVLQFLNR